MRLIWIAAVALGCRGADSPKDSAVDSGSPVDTEVTDSAAPVESGETDDVDVVAPLSDVLFDVTRVFDVEISLDPDDWDTLRYQSRSYASLLGGEDCLEAPFDNPYTWFPASVTVDGVAYDTVGVRKKGLIGSASTAKPGLKLDLDEYVDNPDLYGLDKLTLNNSVQDPSFVRQCLAYAAFADAGVPAPRCGFAHVTVNGEDMGVYVHVERIGGDFLRSRFGEDDGSLYEGTLSDFRDGWTGTFEAKTDTTDAGGAPLQAVIDALDAPDDELLDALDAVIDLDAYLTYWAAEVLVAHWDGYAGNTNNFYVYAPSSDGRLRFVPWGTDGALVSWFTPDGVYATGALARRLYTHDAGRELYLDRMRWLLDEVWDETAMLERADVMEDTLVAELDVFEALDMQAAIDEVRVAIGERRGRVEAELGMTWTADLRGDPCLVEVGAVQADMSTTWDSLNTSPDPFSEGTTTWTLTWDGAEIPITSAGSIAGWSGDVPLIGVAAALPDGSLVLPYVWWSPSLTASGAVLPLDGGHADGAFLYTAEHLGWEWVTIGYLVGELRLDEVSTEPGAPVHASMDVAVLGSG